MCSFINHQYPYSYLRYLMTHIQDRIQQADTESKKSREQCGQFSGQTKRWIIREVQSSLYYKPLLCHTIFRMARKLKKEERGKGWRFLHGYVYIKFSQYILFNPFLPKTPKQALHVQEDKIWSELLLIILLLWIIIYARFITVIFKQ